MVGSASSTRSQVHGLCREVEVFVGGVKKVLPFFVIEYLAQDVILGRLWERMVRAKHDNRDDGSLFLTISDVEGNSATFCAVPADHSEIAQSRREKGGPGWGPLASDRVRPKEKGEET